jgi:hypothetical protein
VMTELQEAVKRIQRAGQEACRANTDCDTCSVVSLCRDGREHPMDHGLIDLVHGYRLSQQDTPTCENCRRATNQECCVHADMCVDSDRLYWEAEE